jgi:hypothetical protein
MKSKADLDGLEVLLKEHLEYRKNSDAVNLLWSGYIAALLVEGSITISDYDCLSGHLKDVAPEELRELFIGYPGQFD